jgi:hypothetical protein
MELTFKEKWMKFWGFGYVVNLRKRSKEIHRLSHKHVNCNLHMMTNYKYVTKKKALKLLSEGYDGCRFCWKNRDNG